MGMRFALGWADGVASTNADVKLGRDTAVMAEWREWRLKRADCCGTKLETLIDKMRGSQYGQRGRYRSLRHQDMCHHWVDLTSNTPFCISSMEISKVPPPRS